jgi:hypothetical protein
MNLFSLIEDNQICLSTVGFFSPTTAQSLSNVINDDNVHIFLELATVANKWDQSYVKFIGTNSNLDWYGMLHDVLHNGQIPSDQSYSELIINNYLNTAPCDGPWDDPNWNPSISCDLYTAEPTTTSGWRGASRLFHPGLQETGDCGQDFRGEFSGLDYMLYYNLHQLLWSNTLTGYQRSINCACIEEITIESNTTEPILVSRKFEDYKSKGIPIESYLAHNLEVSNATGILNVKNDFIICNENPLIPTELTITDGAQLNLYAENTITVRKGNTLRITSGSTMRVGYAKMKVIIPSRNLSGAKLFVEDSLLS